MTEHEDYFKCRDCKYELCCPVDPDNRACDMFSPKKKVRLPIEEELFTNIALSRAEEPITFSEKEKVILLEVLYKDVRKCRRLI